MITTNRDIFEKVLTRHYKTIDRLKLKQTKILEKHMELENNIYKTTTTWLKQSWSRTVKENSLEKEIATYEMIVDNLNSLFRMEYKTDFNIN